jgi:predicted DsbA family dithiol-disulfide isomerase
MIKLDIISDPVCPWCYIGKAELDNALAERPDHPFSIEWHPFQLNPEMPAEGMDRKDYMEAKFGGQSGAASAYAPVLEGAEALDLNVDFSAIDRQPNTLNAHRLIHWAGLEGRQTAAVSALFKAFFNEYRDIGHTETLTEIGSSIGMDKEILQRLFAGDADAKSIKDRDVHARQRGVSGVPCFIIANTHALSGAQPKSLWLQVLDELSENQKESID